MPLFTSALGESCTCRFPLCCLKSIFGSRSQRTQEQAQGKQGNYVNKLCRKWIQWRTLGSWGDGVMGLTGAILFRLLHEMYDGNNLERVMLLLILLLASSRERRCFLQLLLFSFLWRADFTYSYLLCVFNAY